MTAATETVTVVGAGPVGALLASLLAARGYGVELFERRPDMRKTPLAAGRSINLAVSVRGLHALQQIGLDGAVLDCTVPMVGRMVHNLAGQTTLQPYGRDASQRIYSMSRGGLNQILLDRAEQTGLVKCHFGQCLTHYDFATQTADFMDTATQSSHSLSAPVIFGADGSASALRGALVNHGGQESVAPLDFGYKELTLPASAEGGFALDPNVLHIWPRGRYMLIALPNRDGTFTCTLFLPHHGAIGTPHFAGLSGRDEVRAFFDRDFADAAALIPDLVDQYFAGPVGHMATLHCEPWATAGALLLGDAAHAIVPFFGQGMNAGFESCVAFMHHLDKSGLPHTQAQWQQALATFWRDRKHDTDAIAALAEQNFVEMRDKVADPDYLLQRAVETAAQTQLGPAYWSRYQMVSFSRLPYAVARSIGQTQADILAEACRGKTALADVDVAAVVARMRQFVVPQIQAHVLE